MLSKTTAGITILHNPVVSNLYAVHDKAERDASISITTATGSKVLMARVAVESVQTTIKTSGLAPGTYFLQYINNGEMQTKKFNKQ